MVIALFFLVVAAGILYKSVRDLKLLLRPRSTDVPLTGCKQRLAYVIALILWTFAGVIALSTGIGKIIERFIISLQ